MYLIGKVDTIRTIDTTSKVQVQSRSKNKKKKPLEIPVDRIALRLLRLVPGR